MNDSDQFWWCSAHLRVTHPSFDSAAVSKRLNSELTIPKGSGVSKSAADESEAAEVWSLEYRIDSPKRPDVLLSWAESFVSDREPTFASLLADDFDIDIYIGIHSNVLALGFELPSTPTLSRLNIRIGIEFFAS